MKLNGPEAVRALVEGAGFPAAYRAWREGSAPPLPFCVFYAGRSDNFSADGIVYSARQRYTIELYTEAKEPETEARLERALTAAGLFWTKDETYIPEERLHEIIFEIEVSSK